MDKTVIKIANILALIIAAIGIFFTIRVMMTGDDAFKSGIIEQGEIVKSAADVQSGILNPFFYICYIAIIICIVAVLLFPLYNIITRPKSALTSLVGIGILAVVAIIAWSMGSGSIEGEVYQKFEITPSVSRNVDMGIIGTYIFFALACLAIVYHEISKNFK